jgi:hypothetical protein
MDFKSEYSLLSLSRLSLQLVSRGIEQSVPAQPSIQLQWYSPSSSVHWPWREHPFSQPAVIRNPSVMKCYKYPRIELT